MPPCKWFPLLFFGGVDAALDVDTRCLDDHSAPVDVTNSFNDVYVVDDSVLEL